MQELVIDSVQNIENLNLPKIVLKGRSVGATTMVDSIPFKSRSERRAQLKKDISEKNIELKRDVDEKGKPRKNHFQRKTEAKAAVLNPPKITPEAIPEAVPQADQIPVEGVSVEGAENAKVEQSAESAEPSELVAPKLNRHGRRAAKAIALIETKKAIEHEKAKAKRELKRKQIEEKQESLTNNQE